jgi:hypothetical protein
VYLLHCAVRKNHLSPVKLLLRYGHSSHGFHTVMRIMAGRLTGLEMGVSLRCKNNQGPGQK